MTDRTLARKEARIRGWDKPKLVKRGPRSRPVWVAGDAQGRQHELPLTNAAVVANSGRRT